jgi:hypothetical protein
VKLVGLSPKSSPPVGPRCSGCGATYCEEGWRSLLVAERLVGVEVRRFIRDWPDALCIEVRRCRRCGHTIASKRRADEA